MGIIRPLDTDPGSLDLATRLAVQVERRWVAVANEAGPLAHPVAMPSVDRRGEVCWWIGTEESPGT